MRTTGGFVLRLIVYGIALTLATLVFRYEWSTLGLDSLATAHDAMAAHLARVYNRIPILAAFAAVLGAALGSVWKHFGTLVLWAALAAVIAAPIAIAHATGG